MNGLVCKKSPQAINEEATHNYTQIHSRNSTTELKLANYHDGTRYTVELLPFVVTAEHAFPHLENLPIRAL